MTSVNGKDTFPQSTPQWFVRTSIYIYTELTATWRWKWLSFCGGTWNLANQPLQYLKKKTTFGNNIAPFTRLLACHAASVQRAPGWGQPVTVLWKNSGIYTWGWIIVDGRRTGPGRLGLSLPQCGYPTLSICTVRSGGPKSLKSPHYLGLYHILQGQEITQGFKTRNSLFNFFSTLLPGIEHWPRCYLTSTVNGLLRKYLENACYH